MNTLSIMLYLANVIPNIGVFLPIVASLCVIGFMITVLALALKADSTSHYRDSETFQQKMVRFKPVKNLLIPGIVCGFISTLIPNQTTILMITASQIAEQVVNSDTGKNALDLVNAEIQKRLKEIQDAQTQTQTNSRRN